MKKPIQKLLGLMLVTSLAGGCVAYIPGVYHYEPGKKTHSLSLEKDQSFHFVSQSQDGTIYCEAIGMWRKLENQSQILVTEIVTVEKNTEPHGCDRIEQQEFWHYGYGFLRQNGGQRYERGNMF